jgi:hypothetical protein
VTGYLERSGVARNLKALLLLDCHAPRRARGAGGKEGPVAFVPLSAAGFPAAAAVRSGAAGRRTRSAVDAPDIAVAGTPVLALPT